MEQPEEFKPKTPEQREKLPPVEVVGRSVPSEAHLERNEDAIGVLPEQKAGVLCDGVGGMPAGDQASQMARNIVGQRLREMPEHLTADEVVASLKQAVTEAHTAIFEYGQTHPEAYDLRTTLVASKILEQADGTYRAVIAQVGDSRVYIRHASGVLEQVTLDDNMLGQIKDMPTKEKREIQRLLNEVSDPSGLDQKASLLFRHSYYVHQTLGQSEVVNKQRVIQPLDVHTYSIALERGDEIILMSDGISDFLTTGEMASVLNLTRWAENIPQNLINAAKTRARNTEHPRVKNKGDADDMSVIVIQIPSAQPATEEMHDPTYFKKEIAKIVGAKENESEEIPSAKPLNVLPDGFDADKAIREMSPSKGNAYALLPIVLKIGDIGGYKASDINQEILGIMDQVQADPVTAIKRAEKIPGAYGPLRGKVIEFIKYRAGNG